VESRAEVNRAELGTEANRVELRSEKKPAQPRIRRRNMRQQTSQVASSGIRNFRVIVVVTVNELSNKQLHLILNPLIICHGTPDT
jgi:hypothetical protein